MESSILKVLQQDGNYFVLLPPHHECVSYLIAMANSTNFFPDMKALLHNNPVMITADLYTSTKIGMTKDRHLSSSSFVLQEI